MVRTYKLLQMLLLLAGITMSISSRANLSGNQKAYQYQGVKPGGGGGGGDFPWPWGLEVAFPWNDIQGVWKAEYKGKVYYFGFRRVEERRLFITQFDAGQCSTLGSGPGLIRNSSQKYVVAQITLQETGEVYRVAIYAFAEADSPAPPVTNGDVINIPEHVMVARINNIKCPERDIAVQMVRISDRLEFKCVGQDKRLKF
ncbi:MAG: hypothetical protein IPM97_16425 [Bdellovibrionaceae bacterium]|nr:hypothetical protein [Pseudobdellovibrionaceae bacterium]